MKSFNLMRREGHGREQAQSSVCWPMLLRAITSKSCNGGGLQMNYLRPCSLKVATVLCIPKNWGHPSSAVRTVAAANRQLS
mmetsp:Transcript_45692/g.83965  ORF Transcript_45692/g.83965 Transcript_45692/m.83965 type:complete len:81 (+) Transcript_45692:165-407(+)